MAVKPVKKGIKQIKHSSGIYLDKMSSSKYCVIAADQKNSFVVSEWLEGTTDKDKAGVKWLLEDDKRNQVHLQISNPNPQVNDLTIPANMCGAANIYYLEATLTGVADRTTDTGMFVRGYCTPAVVKSQWCDTSRNPLPKDKPISFGDDVVLHIDTQGLCNSQLVIKVYHRNWGSDLLIDTFTGVPCPEGQVNLQIQDTFSWYAKVWHISEHEFYVTVEAKEVTGLVKDTTPHGDTLHARFLRVNNKLLNTPKTAPEKNLTPVKTGDNDLNIKRYEPCGFSRIEVKDDDDRVVLFDETKLQLKGQSRNNFDVSEVILYDFDKSEIRADAMPILDKLASFLLESPYVPVELGSHTDSVGTDEYNMVLSGKRADSAVKYLVSKGVSAERISAKGYGKTMLLYADKNATPEQQQQNRRTTLKFKIYQNNAESLTYETISPDSTQKKELDFTIKDFKVAGCIFEGTPKAHDNKKIKVVTHTSASDKEKPEPSINMQGEIMSPKVYSNLDNVELLPFKYIWPIHNATNNFLYYVNSCRYFSDKSKPSILVKAYPDIKWTFGFHLDLTNDLSVKGQNLSKDKLKDLQKKAGKIGAERRWQQKDASWKLSLKAEWDKASKKKEYSTQDVSFKFKKFYDLFASMGNLADGITSKTKGFIRNIGFKDTPITFEVKPPNLTVEAVWYLKRAHQQKMAIEKIGTQIEFNIAARPLIGLEMTVDLLGLAIGAVAGAVSEGTASQPAMKLYYEIKGLMNKGVSAGDDEFGVKATADVYIDLVISSVINLEGINFSFNTVSDLSDTKLKLETNAKLKAEIKAGMYVKAEVSLVAVTADAYFEASAKASGSVTFGHSLNCDTDGVYYRPILGFDGLNAEYVVVAKAGLSTKKVVNDSEEHEFYKKDGHYDGIIPKFDVIEGLESASGISANFYFIKND